MEETYAYSTAYSTARAISPQCKSPSKIHRTSRCRSPSPLAMIKGKKKSSPASCRETEHRKLADKLDAATVVLWQRLWELGSATGQAEERPRLTDALLTRDIIRRIELKIPARRVKRLREGSPVILKVLIQSVKAHRVHGVTSTFRHGGALGLFSLAMIDSSPLPTFGSRYSDDNSRRQSPEQQRDRCLEPTSPSESQEELDRPIYVAGSEIASWRRWSAFLIGGAAAPLPSQPRCRCRFRPACFSRRRVHRMTALGDFSQW